LKKIPLVAVEVFEDGDGAVGFLAGGLEEADAAELVRIVVGQELVGVKKDKHAAAGLVANGEGLCGSGGFGEEESGAAGIRRSDENPTLVIGEGNVLEQLEAEFLGVEGEGFVVIADDDGQVRDGLGHGFRLWHFQHVE
jgi:hypothetical protein